jgi:hypothetical protein
MMSVAVLWHHSVGFGLLECGRRACSCLWAAGPIGTRIRCLRGCWCLFNVAGARAASICQSVC